MPIRPQDLNPDRPAAGRQPERKTQDPRHYGKDATFNPAKEVTDDEEYKSGGLSKMAKYSVDKR